MKLLRKIVIFINFFIVMFLVNTILLPKPNINAQQNTQYCYVKISEYTKEINEKTKKISFVHQKNHYEINLDYNFYLKSDSSELEYYANITKNSRQNCIFLKNIRLVVFDNDEYLMEIMFDISEIANSFVIIVDLDKTEFDSINIYDKTSDEINKEIESMITMNFTNILTEKKVDNEEDVQTYSFGDLVLENDDDMGATGQSNTSYSWADKDDTIKQYNPNGRTSYSENHKYKDDDIVKSIPRSYFYTEGYHNIMGKEFGCYILTKLNYEGYCSSIVFVYDIEVTKPGMITGDKLDWAVATIVPMFQHQYAYYTKDYDMLQDKWSEEVEEGYDDVIISKGATTTLYLTNIQTCFVIENKNSLNVNQTNYDVAKDKGDFIQEFGYSASGTEFDGDKSNECIYDTINFALGKIPYIGTSVEITSLFLSILNDINDTLETKTVDVSLGEDYTFESKYANAINQYNVYGNLLKAVKIVPNCISNNNNLIMYGTNQNDYVKTSIKLAGEKQDGTSEECNIYVGFYTELVYDASNEDILDNDDASDIYLLDTSTFFFNYGEYQRSCNYLNIDTDYQCNVNVAGEYIYFRFKPSNTTSYTIQTLGDCDTYMYLYSENGELISSNDDGGNNRNSLISKSLEKNVVYTIIIKLYDYTATGTFQIIVE